VSARESTKFAVCVEVVNNDKGVCEVWSPLPEKPPVTDGNRSRPKTKKNEKMLPPLKLFWLLIFTQSPDVRGGNICRFGVQRPTFALLFLIDIETANSTISVLRRLVFGGDTFWRGVLRSFCFCVKKPTKTMNALLPFAALLMCHPFLGDKYFLKLLLVQYYKLLLVGHAFTVLLVVCPTETCLFPRSTFHSNKCLHGSFLSQEHT